MRFAKIRPPPSSPLFPYTTLFRSRLPRGLGFDGDRVRLCPAGKSVFVELMFTEHTLTRRAEPDRSEEHTSELQSHVNLVCCLLLEKKKFRPGVRSDLRRRL